MVTDFVDAILRNFYQYTEDWELYNVAFTVLCICITLIAVGAIFSLICTFVKGWFK